METALAIFELLHRFESYVLALLVSVPRMLAFFSTAMLFSQSAMTRMARNGLVLTLCLPLAPLNLRLLESGSIAGEIYLLMVIKEYFLGFMLGYCFGWIFWGIQSAGALIDNQRGASIAESLDPLQGHQTSPLGNLFSQAITTYLFLTGGILLLVGVLYQSYVIWPTNSFTPQFPSAFAGFALSLLDTGMRAAFVFAAPLIVIMFIAEAALALISRFAPQLQVFVLAMPIKSGIAMFIIVIYVVVLFPEAASKTREAILLSNQLFGLVGAGSPPLQEGQVP